MARAAYPGVMDDYWAAVFWSLLPTVVVCAIFFFILRGIIRADRTERREYARIETQERARLGLPPAAARVLSEQPLPASDHPATAAER